MLPDSLTGKKIKLTRRKAAGWVALGVGLTGSFLLGAVRDAHYGGDVTWRQSYTVAMREAGSAHRPMLISFHRSDCDWCRKMDADTFTDSAVVEASHAYICVRVDGRTEPELALKFGVSAYPYTVAMDSEGKVIGRLEGYASATEFQRFLKSPAIPPQSAYLP